MGEGMGELSVSQQCTLFATGGRDAAGRQGDMLREKKQLERRCVRKTCTVCNIVCHRRHVFCPCLANVDM